MNQKIKTMLMLLIPLFIAGAHIFILVNYASIRDVYENVIIADDLVDGIWAGVFLSILTCMLIYCLISFNKMKLSIMVLMILILFSVNIMYHYYIFSKDYPLNIIEERLDN